MAAGWLLMITTSSSHLRMEHNPGRNRFLAPVASGWSVCRVGFSPTGKRRLITAHTLSLTLANF
jgi:hypothetical protein